MDPCEAAGSETWLPVLRVGLNRGWLVRAGVEAVECENEVENGESGGPIVDDEGDDEPRLLQRDRSWYSEEGGKIGW